MPATRTTRGRFARAGAILRGLHNASCGGASGRATVKKPQTKAEIRARLEEEVRHYLEAGGSVESIAAGISGRESPGSGYSPRSFFNEPKVPRTPIPEVIAAIEARRQSMRQQSASGKRRKA